MSDFTDVILLFSYLEDSVLQHIISQPCPPRRRTALQRIQVGQRGRAARALGRHPRGAECHVLAGTFNHLNTGKLRSTLQQLPWKCPHSVQLLLHNENDALFGMWILLDGHWLEVPIPRTTRRPADGHLHRTDCPDDEYQQP
ncbi:hypothetical protein AB0J30_37225 [Streptomyces microflavus]|uniref:hypothetical protein n=1 Tax=Streptomyces microflavus TaxID=1919 RepID=UPI0033A781F0